MKTLLVVDGNRESLRQSEQMLKDEYHIHAVKSAADMFLLSENARPDMILLGAGMPDMSCAETLTQLKKHNCCRHISRLWRESIL